MRNHSVHNKPGEHAPKKLFRDYGKSLKESQVAAKDRPAEIAEIIDEHGLNEKPGGWNKAATILWNRLDEEDQAGYKEEVKTRRAAPNTAEEQKRYVLLIAVFVRAYEGTEPARNI